MDSMKTEAFRQRRNHKNRNLDNTRRVVTRILHKLYKKMIIRV